MKALTVCQPWASLIIAGAKPYEFRGWRPPRSIIGQRIVIHAAAKRPDFHECRRLYLALNDRGSLVGKMTCLHAKLALPILAGCCDALPRSAGIGIAMLGEPRLGTEIAEEFGVPRANDSDRDEHANWGWPMFDIEPWPEPIPMRGAQGLWNWPEPASIFGSLSA